MKRICFILLAYTFSSCNNAGENAASKSSDTVGNTNPISIDTIKHPSGVDNSSVISTDTAAMNVQNTIKKADSIKKAKQ